MPEENNTIPLTKLPINTKAIVVSIQNDKAIAKKLREMGIVKGITIYTSRIAPLGDPLEITILGYKLAIRKNHASGISVKPVEEEK
ncbi:MAG: FeoA domain-containing protein [bacterium]